MHRKSLLSLYQSLCVTRTRQEYKFFKFFASRKVVIYWIAMVGFVLVSWFMMLVHLPLIFSSSFSLGGRHLNFTMIHSPPFVDMGVSDGAILAQDSWTGYLVDMVKIISHSDYGDFTYTLSPPTGEGSYCSGNDELSWAGQYKCGEQDTYSLNHTAGYWSMYYETPARIEAGTLFTTPFLTRQGLSLLVKSPEVSIMDTASKIAHPFSGPLWCTIFACIVFASIVTFLGEHMNDPKRVSNKTLRRLQANIATNNSLTMDDLEHIVSKGSEIEFDRGLLSEFSLKDTLLMYFLAAWNTVTTHGDSGISLMENNGISKSNAVFAGCWAALAILLVMGYTANLAAILTTDQLAHEVTSLEQMNTNDMTACAQSGAAYTDFIRESFPAVTLVLGSNMQEMVEMMVDEKCDAVVGVFATLEAIMNGKTDLDMSADHKFCFADDVVLDLVGEPLMFGLTNMAVGISGALPEVRDVLSYWITALTACNPSQASSICYYTEPATNLALLKDVHLEPGVCPGNIGDSADFTLTPTNFMIPFAVVAVVGVLSLTTHFFHMYTITSGVGEVSLDEVLRTRKEAAEIWDKQCSTDQVRYLYIPRLIRLFNNADHDFRLALLQALEKYYLSRNMEMYFLLRRVRKKITSLGGKASLMGKPYLDCVRVLLKIGVCQLYHDNPQVVAVVDERENTDNVKVKHIVAMQSSIIGGEVQPPNSSTPPSAQASPRNSTVSQLSQHIVAMQSSIIGGEVQPPSSSTPPSAQASPRNSTVSQQHSCVELTGTAKI
jgi:hypothetical protein